MAFNSLAYALLLTFTVVWMAIGPSRALMLIVASLIFYAAAGPFDMLVFLGAVILNWLIQVAVPADRRRIVAAVIVNIGLIGYFKYRNMLLGETSSTGSFIDVTLPLGISFYSFQALAYHIDVVRGRNGPARSFPEFFLFKAFFPQLIAGPIVRPNQTLPQIQRIFDDKWRRHRLLVFGLSLIVLGLIKKVVLADSLAPVVDDIFYVRPDSAYLAWLGAVLFLFQIYFDFSGYSDIAIGSAYLLGIRLPRNFATPFLAPSIQQLWQRWHITLTLFLRDYLFLPLADMRVVTRRYRVIQHFCAIVLTMTFCGLWHGAGWNFVLWGALQGVAMVFAALWSRYLPSPPAPVGWAATITFFVVTLVFFRSPNLGYAFNYLDTMLSFRGGWPAVVDDAAPPWEVVAGVVGLFALHWVEFRLQQPGVLLIMRRAEGPVSRGFLSGVALLLVLIPVTNVNPFIYFRF
jgi:D-alanyl-lipoteichoic acid acyltransferase DltB (MBOAT superfamily)